VLCHRGAGGWRRLFGTWAFNIDCLFWCYFVFFTLLCINAVRMPLIGFYALARAGYAIEVKRQIDELFNGKSFNHIKVKCIYY
jgi:hypothetical protein